MSRLFISLLFGGALLACGFGPYLIGADDKPSRGAPKAGTEKSERSEKADKPAKPEAGDAAGPKAALPRKHSMPNVREGEDELLKEEAILQALAEPMDIEFTEMPLKDALLFLKEATKVDLRLDEGTISDAGVATDQPVNLKATQVRADSVLNLILGPLELDWLIRDEMLQITTREKADKTLETHLYGVAELYEGGHTADELIDAITSCVSPSTWEEADGSGSIRSLSNALAVWQTQRVHREVELFLTDLVTLIEQDEALTERTGRERIALKVYHTGAHSADKVAESLKKLISPKSWESAGGPGSIHAVDGALLVRQTVSVHRELEKVLKELNPPRLRGQLAHGLLHHRHHDDDDDDDGDDDDEMKGKAKDKDAQGKEDGKKADEKKPAAKD